MKDLISIRMRASKKISSEKSKGREENPDLHISGAEGIYKPGDINKIVKDYIKRALSHSRGKPDKIVITIENIKTRPEYIKSLPVTTLKINSVKSAEYAVKKILLTLGISSKAISSAFEILHRANMRGASLISSLNGERLEYDKNRGIRVSRLGISKYAEKILSNQLKKYSINTNTVKEAIILASKVASSGDIIAEVCISDDPEYTTGYVSSLKYGYLRIPHIKKKNSMIGGRVFFIDRGKDINKVIDYLEKTPAIINKISQVRGTVNINEIFSNFNK